ncbi:MAG: hypothetical protein U0797_18195 [Gemmataceae bacterium]
MNGRAGTLHVKNTKGQEFEMTYAEFMPQWNFHQSPVIGKGFLEGVLGATTRAILY